MRPGLVPRSTLERGGRQGKARQVRAGDDAAPAQGPRRGEAVHPAAGLDRGLIVLASVTRPTEEEGRHIRRSGCRSRHNLGSVELSAAVEFLEGTVHPTELGAHELADDGDAREDVFESLALG